MSTNTTDDSPIFGEDYAYYNNIKTPAQLGMSTKGNLSIKSGIFKLRKFPFSVDITLKEMLEPRKDADRCEKLLKKK